MDEAAVSELTIVHVLLKIFLGPENIKGCDILDYKRLIRYAKLRKPNYAVLASLERELDEARAPKAIRKVLLKYKKDLESSIRDIRTFAEKTILANDSILLYAHSTTVHAALIAWLKKNPNAGITLYFCQCWPKSKGKGMVFARAKESAEAIFPPNAKKVYVYDCGVGELIESGKVNKVFFGAHQYSITPDGKAWFTNTPGTLPIASIAHAFQVPIFVFADRFKKVTDSPSNCEPYIEDVDGCHVNKNIYDLVESRFIPFFLLTEEGLRPCRDHSLRKSNHIKIEQDYNFIVKTSMDFEKANSEKSILHAFAGNEIFQVPRIHSLGGRPPKYPHIAMERKHGVRLHDFIATLNQLKSHMRPTKKLACSIDRFRESAKGWAIESIQFWQKANIPGHGKNQSNPSYDFSGKLKEAFFYMGTHLQAGPMPPNLEGAITTLSQSLQDRATVPFRDATLKNQLLDIEKLVDASHPMLPNLQKPGYYPLVDIQWHGKTVAKHILERLGKGNIQWEDIRSNLWQVDFEMAFQRTTPEDDYIHVLALEIFNLKYDEIIDQICVNLKRDEQQNKIEFSETLFFRCFRAYARRTYYCHHHPGVFRSRYFHESLSHYKELAKAALSAFRRAHPDYGEFERYLS